jgi:hypothetical protein
MTHFNKNTVSLIYLVFSRTWKVYFRPDLISSMMAWTLEAQGFRGKGGSSYEQWGIYMYMTHQEWRMHVS